MQLELLKLLKQVFSFTILEAFQLLGKSVKTFSELTEITNQHKLITNCSKRVKTFTYMIKKSNYHIGKKNDMLQTEAT